MCRSPYRRIKMTKREFIDKNGNTWNWEETPETIEALKQLHNTSVNNRVNRPHNYQGQSYAPHPGIKKQDDEFNYDTSGK